VAGGALLKIACRIAQPVGNTVAGQRWWHILGLISVEPHRGIPRLMRAPETNKKIEWGRWVRIVDIVHGRSSNEVIGMLPIGKR